MPLDDKDDAPDVWGEEAVRSDPSGREVSQLLAAIELHPHELQEPLTVNYEDDGEEE